jgi:hypothetical protein
MAAGASNPFVNSPPPSCPKARSIEIDRFIDEALKGGLLTLGADVAARHDELSAEELSALAKRLSDFRESPDRLPVRKEGGGAKPGQSGTLVCARVYRLFFGTARRCRIAYENYLQLHPKTRGSNN